MAKRKADPQAVLDREPSRKEPPPEELKKPGGRTIGAWRKEAVNFLGKGADDSDLTAHIVKVATEAGYDYQTTDEETREWRLRIQSEIDGAAPIAMPRRGRVASPTEPTLSNLLALLTQLKDAELPDLNGLAPVEAWMKVIESVESLAVKAGGLTNLKKCLEAANTLAALAGG